MTEGSGRIAPRRWQSVLAVAILLVQEVAFIELPRMAASVGVEDAPDVTASESNPFNLQCLLATSVIALIASLLQRRQVGPAYRANLPLWLMVVAALVSTAWSIAPGVTLRRGIAFAASTVALLWIASTFDLHRCFRLLAWSIAIAAAGSIALMLLRPDLAYMSDPGVVGDLRGVFSHKNVLGHLMGVGVMNFIYLLMAGDRPRLLLWGGAGLCCVLAVLSHSATALVTILLVVASAGLYQLWRLPRKIAVLATVALVGVVAVAALAIGGDPSVLLNAAGRDATLTGRTELWAEVVGLVAARPVLGWGYAAFWINDNPLAAKIWQVIGWTAPHSHNGLLELLLDFGALGILLLTWFLAVYVGRIVGLLRQARSLEAWLGTTLLFLLVLANVTEPNLLRHQHIDWILAALFVAAARPARVPPTPAAPFRIVDRARPLPFVSAPGTKGGAVGAPSLQRRDGGRDGRRRVHQATSPSA